MLLPLAQSPLAPEQIARRYDSSIVVRRWGATWIDFLLLIFLLVASLALPDRLQPFALLLSCLLALAYFVVLEHVFGRTLGKIVCRVRIVDSTGGRPSWGQAIIRTLLRVLEVNPALLGGIPAGVVVLSSKKRQRLGDMAASTFVLREEDARYLSRLREHAPATNLSHPSAPPGAPLPPPPVPPPPDTSTQWLLPTNRSGWAIAAGYLGLFAVLCIPAPFALVAGVFGLLEIGRIPGLGGKGRAIFGIVMGSLFSVILLILAVSALLGRA
jgi:uncharacterized RDD family membrane protein YckC